MKLKSEPDPHLSSLRECSIIICDACAAPNPSSRCKTCHLTFYCHEACASNHWQVHKSYCKSTASVLSQSQLVVVAPDSSTAPQKSRCGLCETTAAPMPLYHFCNANNQENCCENVYCLECTNNYKLYESSLLISSTKSTLEQKCPLCRVKEDNTSELYLINQAILWTARAASSQEPNVSQHAHKALTYIESLLEQDSSNTSAKIMQGRVLGLLGEYELGLTLLRESLTRLQSPQQQQQQTNATNLMEKVKECMVQGKVDQAEEYLEQIQNLRNQKFALLVQPADLIDLKLCIADLELKSNGYNACQHTLVNTILEQQETMSITPDQKLQAYLKLAQCWYETNQYDKSIEAANLAIDMNRHYPQVYKYAILSYRDRGQFEQAKQVASRAVLYETPWDAQNQQTVQGFYDQLFDIEEQ